MTLRNYIFNLYIILSNVILLVSLWPFFLFNDRVSLFALDVWAKNFILSTKYLGKIDYEIIGNIPTEPVIIACKHQSAWDTALFFMLYRNPAYVIKKELTYIPIFGFLCKRAGQISVDRKAGASALKNMVKLARERIAQNRWVVIFPEGTRALPGARSEIKPGIAALYNSVDAPVIPVSLNSGDFWPRNSWRKKPGKITVVFGEALPKGLSREELISRLEVGINKIAN